MIERRGNVQKRQRIGNEKDTGEKRKMAPLGAVDFRC